ncbi:hypothetical protein BESB_078810 [Besnoitia besnoiti]|uniref:Uncharacterized protein n=1 Tax=Besnoitia besnoiti TaxID=94643 RepID=A0A2A9M6P9_BESBE|nr:hypothetical protein BESB_078810 [Besnoitia besnoiti]PFH33665.1 hypothetical protein BESB_078810 [Besnoitia besnoiti]
MTRRESAPLQAPQRVPGATEKIRQLLGRHRGVFHAGHRYLFPQTINPDLALEKPSRGVVSRLLAYAATKRSLREARNVVDSARAAVRIGASPSAAALLRRRRTSRANSTQHASLASALAEADSELEALLSLGLPQRCFAPSNTVQETSREAAAPRPPAATETHARGVLRAAAAPENPEKGRSPAGASRSLLDGLKAGDEAPCSDRRAGDKEEARSLPHGDSQRLTSLAAVPPPRRRLEEGEVFVQARRASAFPRLSRTSTLSASLRHASEAGDAFRDRFVPAHDSVRRLIGEPDRPESLDPPLSAARPRETNDRRGAFNRQDSRPSSDLECGKATVAAAAAAEAARGAAAAEAAAAAAADAAAAAEERETSKDLQIEQLRAENRRLHIEAQLLQQRLHSELRACEAARKRVLGAERAQWEAEKNRLEIQNRRLHDEVTRLERHQEEESRRVAAVLQALDEEREQERKQSEQRLSAVLTEEEGKRKAAVEAAVRDADKKRIAEVKELEKKRRAEVEALKATQQEELAKQKQQVATQDDICSLLRHVESSAETIKLMTERLGRDSTHDPSQLTSQIAEREATLKTMQEELKRQQKQTADQHGALVALLGDFQRQQRASEERRRRERDRLDAEREALRQLQQTLSTAEEDQRKSLEELKATIADEKRELVSRLHAKEFELKEREQRLEIAQRRVENERRAVDAAARGVEETRARAAARLREVEGEVFEERRRALREFDALEEEKLELRRSQQQLALLQADVQRRQREMDEEGRKTQALLREVEDREAEISKRHAEATEARAQAELRAREAEQEKRSCEEKLQQLQALSRSLQKEQLDLLRLESRLLAPAAPAAVPPVPLPPSYPACPGRVTSADPLALHHSRSVNLTLCAKTAAARPPLRSQSASFSSASLSPRCAAQPSFPLSALFPESGAHSASAGVGTASLEPDILRSSGDIAGLRAVGRPPVAFANAQEPPSLALYRRAAPASPDESTILPPVILQAFLRTRSSVSARSSAVSTAQAPTSQGGSLAPSAADSGFPSSCPSRVSSVAPFFALSPSNSALRLSFHPRAQHAARGADEPERGRAAPSARARRRSFCLGDEGHRGLADQHAAGVGRRLSSSPGAREREGRAAQPAASSERSLLSRLECATARLKQPRLATPCASGRINDSEPEGETNGRWQRGGWERPEGAFGLWRAVEEEAAREDYAADGRAEGEMAVGGLSAGRADSGDIEEENQFRRSRDAESEHEGGIESRAQRGVSAARAREERQAMRILECNDQTQGGLFDSREFGELADASQALAARQQVLSARVESRRGYMRCLEEIFEQQW